MLVYFRTKISIISITHVTFVVVRVIIVRSWFDRIQHNYFCMSMTSNIHNIYGIILSNAPQPYRRIRPQGHP